MKVILVEKLIKRMLTEFISIKNRLNNDFPSKTEFNTLKTTVTNISSVLTATSATVTKKGNYYTGGNIRVWKNGNCVTVQIDSLALKALTADRTAVANIPSGFRPKVQVYGLLTTMSEYFVVGTNGDISFNKITAASTKWGSVTYCV